MVHFFQGSSLLIHPHACIHVWAAFSLPRNMEGASRAGRQDHLSGSMHPLAATAPLSLPKALRLRSYSAVITPGSFSAGESEGRPGSCFLLEVWGDACRS